MNKKNKRAIGLTLTGVMSVASVAGACGAVDSIKSASAASNAVQAVDAKIEHITYSLKNNYLGLKNVGQWQQYIKEAKVLNAKLPKGSSQDKYAERIDRAEALVNAAARVNQVEKSMAVNAPIIKNVPQWEKYIDLAKEDLAKVDLSVFKPQYNNLLERTAQRSEAINKVKADFDKSLKAVESLYKEAEELAKTDKVKALEKLKEAKEAGEKLNSHASKDEILKKIAELTKSLTDGNDPEKPGDGGSSGGGGNVSDKVVITDASELNNQTYNSKTVVIKLADDEKATITGLTAKNLEITSGSKVEFNNSDITNLTISSVTEVAATGNTKIENTNIKSEVTISSVAIPVTLQKSAVAGGKVDSKIEAFKNVKINTTKKVTVTAPVNSLVVEASNADLAINAAVENIKISAANVDVAINAGAAVVTVTVDSKATQTVLTGEGTINEVVANAPNVKIATTKYPTTVSGTEVKSVIKKAQAETEVLEAIKTSNKDNIATILTNNKAILGLNLEKYSALKDKSAVTSKFAGKTFVTVADVKGAFNTAVDTQATVEANIAAVAKLKEALESGKVAVREDANATDIKNAVEEYVTKTKGDSKVGTTVVEGENYTVILTIGDATDATEITDTAAITVVKDTAQLEVNAEAAKITSITEPAKDATKLDLPKASEGYTVSIKSTDNADVIAKNGTITPPDKDTVVKLVLTVTNTASKKTADTAEISVKVVAKSLEKSKAPLQGNIKVTYTDATSKVEVYGLAAGDVINVYKTATASVDDLLGTSEAVKRGTTKATVENIKLTADQVVYVTVTSTGKTESDTTASVKGEVKALKVVLKDGSTEVTDETLESGRKLSVNVELTDGTIIGTYPENNDVTYKWIIGKDTVLGTGSTVTLTDDNVGKPLSVVVKYKGVETTKSLGTVVAPKVKGLKVVLEDGSTEVTDKTLKSGQKLSVNVELTNGTIIGTNPVSQDVTYKWIIGDDTVLGTESTVTLTDDNVDKKLSVVVKYKGVETTKSLGKVLAATTVK